MEKQTRLRELVDAIKQTPASELSLKVSDKICGYYSEAGYDIGITKRTIKGTFRRCPIYASYLPARNSNYECKITAKKGDYDLPYKTAESVTKILEEKYYKTISEKEERKIEEILKGKS